MEVQITKRHLGVCKNYQEMDGLHFPFRYLSSQEGGLFSSKLLGSHIS